MPFCLYFDLCYVDSAMVSFTYPLYFISNFAITTLVFHHRQNTIIFHVIIFHVIICVMPHPQLCHAMPSLFYDFFIRTPSYVSCHILNYAMPCHHYLSLSLSLSCHHIHWLLLCHVRIFRHLGVS